MVREVVTVQVGQCGNQIGTRFWDLALREHAQEAKSTAYDPPMSAFFRNVDTRHTPHRAIPLGDGLGPISTLKARAVLIDMEEGVVSQTLRSPLSEIYDRRLILTDISGAGNNWAHGHEVYGPQHREGLLERIRRAVGDCDSIQCFSLINSMGGGTGSGLGSYALEAIADEYPRITRLSTSVFPSADDDVITSPYNSVLAAFRLIDFADVTLPIDNQALIELVQRAERPLPGQALSQRVGSLTLNCPVVPNRSDQPVNNTPDRPFDSMNNLVAHALTTLTASVRFPGAMNTDLADLTSNLVPYPRLHFLIPGLAPLYSLRDAKYRPSKLDNLFVDALSRSSQLLSASPTACRFLTCGLLMRGDVTTSDAQRALSKVRPQLQTPWWNPDAFKIGLCSAPPVGQSHLLLSLSNNCCMADMFNTLVARFDKLYRRRAHTHHFTQYMDSFQFDEAREALCSIAGEYASLQHVQPPASAQRALDRLVVHPVL